MVCTKARFKSDSYHYLNNTVNIFFSYLRVYENQHSVVHSTLEEALVRNI
jgi:hypothetical protein